MAYLLGSASAAATSIALPAHAVGNDILIFTWCNNTATVPGIPTASGTVPAWVSLGTSTSAAPCSARLVHFVATANNHTSGIWTGVTGMIAAVVAGVAASPIGGKSVATSASSATSCSAPSITMSATDGTSLLLYFYANRNVTAWGTPAAGWTMQTSVAAQCCCTTKDVTTTDGVGAQPMTTSGTATGMGATAEILTSPNQGDFFVMF